MLSSRAGPDSTTSYYHFTIFPRSNFPVYSFYKCALKNEASGFSLCSHNPLPDKPMKHGKKFHHDQKRSGGQEPPQTFPHEQRENGRQQLELILKCGTAGSIAAVQKSLETLPSPVPLTVIHAGIGDVNKADIILAETGSRLVIGFEVGVIPRIEEYLKQYRTEVRLYTLIYSLIQDVGRIAGSLEPPLAETEEVIGTARVIHLFKSSRKGIILGCEVLSGSLLVAQTFRVISAMGPIFTGRIESMHIERNAVQKATAGQQVGLKINNFQKARKGDMVECLKRLPAKQEARWQPTAGVYVVP